MVAAAIWLAFAGVRLGATNGADESFMALLIRHWDAAPLGMLSFWTAHLWQEVFGHSTAVLRCLVSAEELLAVGAGCLYLWRRSGNALVASLTFLACMATARISDLFDALALIGIIESCRRPRLWPAVACGAALACVALARVPSVILLPICLVAAYIATPGAATFSRLRYAGAILAAFAGTWLLLTTLMTGSPLTYLSTFTTGNIIDGHSPSDWREWMSRIHEVGPITKWKWITAATVAACAWLTYRKIWAVALISVPLAILCVGVMMHFCGPEYVWPLQGYATPILIAFLASGPIWNLLHRRSDKIALPYGELWLCFLFMAGITFGSDTFFERMAVFFIIPCTVCALWTPFRGGGRRFVVALLSLMALTSGAMTVAFNVHKAEKHHFPASAYDPGVMTNEITRDKIAAYAPLDSMIRRNGFRFVVIGDRLYYYYLFGDDNGPSFQNFNLQWQTGPAGALSDSIARADLLIYLLDPAMQKKYLSSPRSEQQGFIPVSNSRYTVVYARQEISTLCKNLLMK